VSPIAAGRPDPFVPETANADSALGPNRFTEHAYITNKFKII
jgi:hypothetical protein